MSIPKVIFPVAGLGTRFLPATKVIPKEMLPIVDKPVIQYAVEEALAAGMKDFIFVTARGKNVIEDHFDKAYELETELERRGKANLLRHVTDFMPKGTTSMFVRQQEALGLGHAVFCARSAVGDNAVAIALPDDVFDGGAKAVLQQMVEVYEQHGGSVIAVENVPREHTNRYGIVEVEPVAPGVSRITNIVEKPDPDKAPSTLAVAGRYILSGRIFELLEQTQTGAGNEIQLTDAIAELLKEEPVYAYEFDGQRYDCGNKLGYLQATLHFGSKHPDVGDGFRQAIKAFAEGL